MKKIFYNSFITVAATLFCPIIMILIFSSCSSRENEPVVLKDSTIIYPSKSDSGIDPKISLSTTISKKTGKPIKPGIKFNLQDGKKLYATVNFQNQLTETNKNLMFHIDWINPEGKSFYKKRIDISPTGLESKIKSSITLSASKRKAGNYSVRVYLFRELIAEKKFQLVETSADSENIIPTTESYENAKSDNQFKTVEAITAEVKISDISANIILCVKVSKKTGKPIGAGTIFTIKEKEKVKALVDIEYRKIKTNEQMIFYFDWIGRNGKSFYKKRIVYTTSNPFFTISNSISIAPEKRKPGNYKVRVYLDDQLIAEQKFELIANIK